MAFQLRMGGLFARATAVAKRAGHKSARFFPHHVVDFVEQLLHGLRHCLGGFACGLAAFGGSGPCVIADVACGVCCGDNVICVCGVALAGVISVFALAFAFIAVFFTTWLAAWNRCDAVLLLISQHILAVLDEIEVIMIAFHRQNER